MDVIVFYYIMYQTFEETVVLLDERITNGINNISIMQDFREEVWISL